jgi:hypothetical protein
MRAAFFETPRQRAIVHRITAENFFAKRARERTATQEHGPAAPGFRPASAFFATVGI